MGKIQAPKFNFEKLNTAATILNSLAHPTRLEIVNILEDGQFKTVGDILAKVKIDPTLLTHHLTKMKNSGVLESSKKGRNVFYRLSIKEVIDIFECVQKL